MLDLLCTASFAAGWPELPGDLPSSTVGKDDVALVIAVGDYGYVADVPGAVANGLAWDAFFARRGTTSRVLLTDDGATTADVADRVAGLAALPASAKGRTWIVFIGHGSPSYDPKVPGGRLWLHDAKPTTVDGVMQRSIDRATLVKQLAGLRGETVAIVDACFSGTHPDGTAKLAVQAPGFMPAPKQKMPATVLSATSSDRFAWPLPGGERPAFSYLVLGALAHDWGANTDGVAGITAAEAVSFADTQLKVWIGDKQAPVVEGAATTSVLAVPSRSEPAPVPGRATADHTPADASACAAEADQKVDTMQRGRLADAVASREAELAATWATLAPQVDACAALTDPSLRRRCVPMFEDFLAHVAAGARVDAVKEDVSTACGPVRGRAEAMEAELTVASVPQAQAALRVLGEEIPGQRARPSSDGEGWRFGVDAGVPVGGLHVERRWPGALAVAGARAHFGWGVLDTDSGAALELEGLGKGYIFYGVLPFVGTRLGDRWSADLAAGIGSVPGFLPFGEGYGRGLGLLVEPSAWYRANDVVGVRLGLAYALYEQSDWFSPLVAVTFDTRTSRATE